MLDRRPHRSWRLLAGATLAIAAALPATPAVAVDPPLSVTIGSCNIDAEATPSTALTALIKSPNGTVRATMTDTSDASGNASFDCTTTMLRPKDVVVLRDASGPLVTFTVPAFSATIDRATDKVVIRGPRNTGVRFEPLGCSPGRVNCGAFDELDLTFDSQGRLSRDVTAAVDLKGSDGVDILWRNAKAFVSWRIPAPGLDVTVGAAKVGGFGNVGDPVLVRLRTGGGTLRGTGTGTPTAPRGTYATFIRNAGGAKVTPSIGDRVTADVAPDAKVTILDIPFTIGATTYTFTCPPNAPWSIQFLDGPRQFTQNGGVADATGVVLQGYNAALTHGMRLVVRCGTASGDAIKTSQLVP